MKKAGPLLPVRVSSATNGSGRHRSAVADRPLPVWKRRRLALVDAIRKHGDKLARAGVTLSDALEAERNA